MLLQHQTPGFVLICPLLMCYGAHSAIIYKVTRVLRHSLLIGGVDPDVNNGHQVAPQWVICEIYPD